MRQVTTKSSVRYSTVQTAKGFLLKESPFNGNGKRPERLENLIIHGDAGSELKLFPADHVDLIFTSPPYADSRKKTYGGIRPDRYVEWFVPFTAEFLRVLKPTGSFVLNIKEKVVGGERHTYVLDLIIQMRKQGWLWTEEYIWHKKNCYPGKWPNRFRDSWERCLHFTKSKHFAMYQETVMVPMGDWKHARLRNLSETDKRRDESKVSSGFGKKIKNGTPPPPPPSGGDGSNDFLFEPNETSNAAFDLGALTGVNTINNLQIKQNAVGKAGDRDWFKFTPTKAGVLTLNETPNTSAGDLDMRLYRSVNGSPTSLTEIGVGQGTHRTAGTPETITVAVAAGTTYYFNIQGFNGGLGNYNLTLTAPSYLTAPS